MFGISHIDEAAQEAAYTALNTLTTIRDIGNVVDSNLRKRMVETESGEFLRYNEFLNTILHDLLKSYRKCAYHTAKQLYTFIEKGNLEKTIMRKERKESDFRHLETFNFS